MKATRTPTLPLTEPAMWRKLLARVHPDTGGDHEVFIWATNLREHVIEGKAAEPPQPPPRAEQSGSSDAVSFDPDLDHIALRETVLRQAGNLPEPYARVLWLLEDCEYIPAGTAYHQQRKGATYKQLAAIGHAVGMNKAQRVRWYRIAEDLPLSRRCAGHILKKLR